MQGQLANLIIIYALGAISFGALAFKEHQYEKAERQRKAKREADRRREMAVVGQRVRRQLTVERFECVKRQKQPVRKFCGELATYDNQSILK